MQQRVKAARRHLEMAVEWKGERIGLFETRRHYTNYFKGYPNFKEYRTRLVTADSPSEVYDTLNEVLAVYGERVLA